MWHKGLITKLISFKFSEYLTVIIRNFLTKRKFQVRVNQVLSSIGDIHAGTPQGSSLSPTLYNIFTADFPKNDNILNCLFGMTLPSFLKAATSNISSIPYNSNSMKSKNGAPFGLSLSTQRKLRPFSSGKDTLISHSSLLPSVKKFFPGTIKSNNLSSYWTTNSLFNNMHATIATNSMPKTIL
ncbi:hypothetical protein AVEN_58141-1 [Araneus ventricosus]|uniref:Uncharacterized protein n=1 Tax=Araneus ventricosus TaxID=182803 RepID=A0A4Y2X5H1_ARAVE|nr:hypothetical protein AVEN_58141-1 [Araneus ventricosus]